MTVPLPRTELGGTKPHRTRPWPALAVLSLANFLVLLDTTIVNVALPDIQQRLGAGIDEALWVVNAYLLAFASLLIVFGRLGDLIGPRTVFVLGLGLFTAASALCGMSATADQLVAARVLQGVGAAALLPQALALISAMFPAHRRGAAFGVFTAVAGVASVAGLTVGGLLVTELGWPAVFYLNVPVGLAGMVLAYRFVPNRRAARRRHRFDPVGVLLATGGLVGIAYGLVEGQRHDWGTIAGPVSIPVVILTGVVLLVLFVRWEQGQPEPLLPLDLFRDRNFAIATLLTLITTFALFGLLIVLVIELQTVFGLSPLASGLAGLPLTVTLAAVAPFAGRLADRIGGRVLLVVGLVVYAAGVLGVAFLPATSSTAAAFVLPLVIVGIGTGLTFAPATTEAMRGIAPRRAGAASAVLNTARQLGAGLGAAVIGAILQNRLTGALDDEAMRRVTQLPDEARVPYLTGFDDAAARGLELGSGQSGGVATPSDLPPDVADRFTALVRDAFADGFLTASRPTLTVVAAVLLAGGVLAACMVRSRPLTPVARSIDTPAVALNP